jgi:hypothetical protein
MAGTRVTTELDIELAKWNAKTEEVRRDIAQMKADAKRGPGLGESLMGSLNGPLGAALSAGAIKGLLGRFDDLADTATKLGETPEVLQRVGRAAELSGTSVEGLAGGFLKLEKALGDSDNSKAVEILEKYGLTAEQLIAMPLDQKVLAIADAFQKARQDGTGVYEIQQLMGKSATELIPLLSATGDELRGMFDGVNVVADENVYAMAALNDEIDNIIGNLTNLGGQALMKAHDGLAYFGASLAYIFGDEKAFDNVDNALAKRIADAQKKADDMRDQRTRRARNTQANIDARPAPVDKDGEAAAKKEEDRWQRIDRLVAELRKGEIDMLPPQEKLDALRAELKDIMAAAAGELDIEKKLQLQIEAQRMQKEIASTEEGIAREAERAVKGRSVKSAGVPGEVTGVINTLFGRSANDLILDESKQQTQQLQRANTLLTSINERLADRGDPITPQEVFAN